MTNRARALVTGASSGIGDAVARGLARRGHDLVVVARSGDRLEKLAVELRTAHGVDVDVLPADLTDDAERAKVEDRLADGAAPIDILVNNAGFGTNGRFAELPIEREHQEIDLNVLAVVRLTRAALPGMVERRRGGILNVSSAASFQPGPRNATYSATKAFVTSFSQAVHEEVAGTGVKVSCLCPGFTHTEFHDVANIDHGTIPGLLWMSAEQVAEAGIAGLEQNHALVVPGLPYKAAAVSVRLMPRGLVRRVAGVVAARL
jgi:short-subunit dehydrogenase